MKSRFVVALVLGLFMVFLAGNAFALEQLVESVVKGCEKELNTYCSQVTPGQGRGLACLYAHNDKLSGQCEYALYDAAVQLERVVAALSYVANECRDDLKSYCSGVQPGEGRIMECMEQNKDKLSERCRGAISDVGLRRR